MAPRSARLLLASALIGLVTAALTWALLGRSNPVRPGPARPSGGSVRELRVSVIVDNNPGPPALKSAWGFSALVEADGVKILFDSGPDPDVLKRNARELGVDLSDVDLVVISHHHGDHVGGLPYLARVSPGLLVYVPSGADPAVLRSIRSLGLEVTELDDPTELSNGVWTTGSMWGPPAEQGLIVNVSGLGAVLITGCAHPKVELMAQRAAEIADERLYAVLGGFHLGSATEARLEGIARVFRSLGVEFVAPLHCSGERARSFFREAMPSAYGDGHMGLALTFDRSGVSVEG